MCPEYWRRRAGALVTAVCVVLLLAGLGSQAGMAADTALGGDKQRTRFILGLDRKVEFQVFSVAAPNRVIIDLPDVKIQLPQMTGAVPVGLVRSFRGGLTAPGKMRVIIDVTDAVVVEKATVEASGGRPRLVLEIIPAGPTRPAAPKKAGLPQPMGAVGAASAVTTGTIQPPMPRPAPRPKAGTMFKPTIVLDPGHGGNDSGAVRFGTIEKQVVLAFALALKARLEATGRYTVLMTRDTDRFIPLHERREFAERHKAALFIAIHADYAGSSARGATIYSLRENVANELARSVKGERSEHLLTSRELETVQAAKADTGALKGILSDLATRETLATRSRTGTFVRSVIEFLGQSTNLMGNPDRGAAFAVLRTAQVPAVLIELGYVTNQRDALQLRSEEWRQRVATSIVTAVENYFSHQIARMPM